MIELTKVQLQKSITKLIQNNDGFNNVLQMALNALMLNEREHFLNNNINKKNILQNPSEVWLESASINNDKYDISFFDFFYNKVIKISVRVFKDKIIIKSFFEVNTEKIDIERKGILIKKIKR